jgi:phosphoglycerate kinase
MTSFNQIDFNTQKALIRVDFNVPVDDFGKVTDDSRIVAALPTILAVIKKKGAVILMSHFGRPKGMVNIKYSLKPIAEHLAVLLNIPVQFAQDCIGQEATDRSLNLKPGEVMLLENLRFYPEEEGGDEWFAEKLSKLGDIYVNDAFGTAHRAHASTSIIAKYFSPEKRVFGLLMGSEVESLERALISGQSPRLAIVGGAKVSSKIDVIEHLLGVVDEIIIGGGMAYTFSKAQGGQIGKSMVEEDKLETAQSLIAKAIAKGVKIHLPIDSVNSTDFLDIEPASITEIGHVPSNQMGLDIGPISIAKFVKIIQDSNTIIWNGPMGVFEFNYYQKGTLSIAQAIANATREGAFSLIGGGDSVAAINQFGLSDQVSYVSTGGGAMLEYLEGKKLPGIAAMEN